MAQTPLYNLAVAPTKSDTVADPAGQWDAIYVGGAGNLIIALPSGDEVTIAAIAGAVLPIAGIRVKNTGTTATALLLLYQV